MAKILCNYFGLSMAAEGKSDFVGRQAAAFLGITRQALNRRLRTGEGSSGGSGVSGSGGGGGGR